MKTKQDYISHWKSKGEYGRIRVERMLERKRLRRTKTRSKSRTCDICEHTYPYEIHKRLNPYDSDIHGVHNVQRICEYCYDSLLGDI